MISTVQNDGFFMVLSVIFVVRTWFLVHGFPRLRICHFFELYFWTAQAIDRDEAWLPNRPRCGHSPEAQMAFHAN